MHHITKQAGSAEPEAAEPEAAEPETAEPETAEPETTEPETTEPETAEPEPTVPEPEEPATEETDVQCDAEYVCFDLNSDDSWDCCPTAGDLEKCHPTDVCVGNDGELYDECCFTTY